MGIKNRATFFRVFSRKYAASSLTGTVNVIPIVGPMLVYALGIEVMTALPAGANTLQFKIKSAGAGTQVALCGATDTASGAVQQLYMVDGVAATGLVKTTNVSALLGAQTMHMPIILADGELQMIWSAGPPATGAIKVFMLWAPITIDTQIPAEGG